MPPLRTSDIGRAVAALRRGGLVAFPTETVYGLGADATDAAAVARPTSPVRNGGTLRHLHASPTRFAHGWGSDNDSAARFHSARTTTTGIVEARRQPKP